MRSQSDGISTNSEMRRDRCRKMPGDPGRGRPLKHHEASLSDCGAVSQEVKLWVRPEFTKLFHCPAILGDSVGRTTNSTQFAGDFPDFSAL